MALSFVNGKPTKVKKIEQPESLEQAMTPIDSPVLNDQLKAQEALNNMFSAKDPEDGGPVLPFKIKVDAVGHVENPPVKVKGELTFTDPEMQAKLGGVSPFVIDTATGAYLDQMASVQTMTKEELVALSQQQEPQNEVVSEEMAASETLALVDEYTALQKQIDAADVSDLIKQQEALKKSLQSIARSPQYVSGKALKLHGTHGNYVEFSAQANTTKIVDKQGLINEMGVGAYIDNTDITLTAAKKVLAEGVLEKFTTTVPGARTLKGVNTGS